MDAWSELRRRWLLIVTVAVACAGATAAYSFTTAKHYRATAILLVQPVPPTELLGLEVLHDTNKRTAAATAARLLRSDDTAARRVRDRLGLHSSSTSLLDNVTTRAVPGTNAVEVTATDTSSARAAQIANGLVDAFVTDRSAGFASHVTSTLRRLRARLAALSPARRQGPDGTQLAAAAAGLQRWVGFADPTVTHGPEAVQPESAAWPHPLLWTLYGGLFGLVAGCLGALGLGLTDFLRRREVTVGTTEHDPRMSERAAERLVGRLEARLFERVDALAAEQARLAAREREIAEQLEHLRAVKAAVPEPAPTPAPAAPQADPQLEERVAFVTRRERAVAERTSELQQIEARVDEQIEALARREQEFAAHEQERREPPPPSPSPAPVAPPPAPVPAVAPPPAPAAAPRAVPANGGWQLTELEDLVAAHADEYPERADEWRSYLFYLRDYTDASGRVPGHFDWLIEDAFGELMAPR